MPVLEDGQVFERYRIRAWLGNGISGESYEAEDRILQRKVTLKLIHPWAMLPDAARRQFFREMQGISLLSHPYLATVLDYGEVEGRLYVARRYASSGSLLNPDGRLWFRPPLPLADAFTYAHQLAQTLQYMHQHGYLHGALTFANVLVLRGPHSKGETGYAPFLVADAGLAHFTRRFGRPQITTLPISTAPEQISQHASPASDQFALAVLLYFWLAGRPPYLGTSDEIARQKLSATITPLSTLNPAVNTAQEAIIRRALAVDPDNRFASILDFGEALLTSLTAPAPSSQPSEPSAETFTQPSATPREFAPFPPSEASTTTFDAPSSARSEDPTPTTQIPASSTEVHPSTLEQLLTKPQTAPGLLPSTGNNQPAPPDTPRLEENISETPPASLVLPELAEAQKEQTNDRLSTETEEETPVHPDQVAESVSEVAPEADPALLEEITASSKEIAAIEPLSKNETQPGNEGNDPLLFPLELPDSKESMPAPPPVTSTGNEETGSSLAREDETVRENNKTTAVPAPPETEIPLAEQENTLLADTVEEEHVQEANSAIAPVPAAATGEIEDTAPVEASREASNETYPPLDEVTVVPRLLISSPYTHSSYEFLLTDEEITIGRAGSSDLYLEQDNLTSRHHALLKRVGERVLIFDRRSYNGVFINGQKIEADQGYELADGDHIGIGNYEIIFRAIPAGHIPQLI